MAVCAPLVSNVSEAVRDDGSIPLPGLPSASTGSPVAVKATVTLFLYQPPLPAKSGGRVAAAVGANGAVWSTLTGADSSEYSVTPVWLLSHAPAGCPRA